MTYSEIYAICINNDFKVVNDEQINHPNPLLRKTFRRLPLQVGTSYKCYYYQEMTFPGGFRNKMVHGNFIYEIIDPYYPRKLMTIYEKDFSRHFTTPEIRNKKIDDILS